MTLIEQSLDKVRKAMFGVFCFSLVANVLLLTSPIFMLQIYDRVLLSRSNSTLLGLLGVALFLLAILLVMEIVRNVLLNRISVRFDKDVSKTVLSEVLSRGVSSKPVHDVNTIRAYINGPFILALFDIPWMPLYLALVYFLHPALGHVGLAGAVILFFLAVLNDRLTKQQFHESGEAFGAANNFVEHSSRNKDAIVGMGMLPSLINVWSMYQRAGLGYHIAASDKNMVISSIAKVVRQMIQVSVLAMGGYLAIQDIASPGVMIAASIIIGRALAPVEQSLQGWRGLVKAKEAYHDLNEFMADYQLDSPGTPLPAPVGKVELSNVVALPGNVEEISGPPKPTIKGVTLSISPGQMVGIIGPSGSGKSTIVRLIMGIIQPLHGSVRVDGAEMIPETQRQFSAYFGYLPQEVELFDGTVAENIARFRQGDPGRVVEAANMAGVHEMILSLREGYETKVGPSGENLSGGQRQRIGLARALFDAPKLVVLDEPTSNLDAEGRASLLSVLKKLKAQNTTVLLIAHQPSLFSDMDKIAYVVDGKIEKYGDAKDVILEMGSASKPGTKPSPKGKKSGPKIKQKPEAAHKPETAQKPETEKVSLASKVAKMKPKQVVINRQPTIQVTQAKKD